jgi:hypothetical protein
MADRADEARARAETKFKNAEQRSREGEQARADEAAKAKSVDEKTARLKALRLANEETEREAALSAKAGRNRK